jgi:hypothetical protein
MATRRGIAPRRVRMPARPGVAPAADARALMPHETAWLLLVPATAVAVAVVVLLGPSLGRLAFTGTDYTYWPSAAEAQLFPKPTELARFALTVACALAFATAIPLAATRPLRMRPAHARIAVGAVQALCLAALVRFWLAQRAVEPYDIGDPTYFAPSAIAVALAIAALGGLAIASPRLVALLRSAPSGAPWRLACGTVAVLATAIWLLPSVFTDASIASAPEIVPGHLRFAFDEAMSVLNGRTPLVDMTTYGALVPYVVALPLAALDASLAAFSTLMVALNALALLAVFAVLLRLTRNPLAALALYVPFLATSFFLVRGDAVERFSFGNYFGMFPIRYAGPYLLLWLVTRHLDGDRPRTALPLFAAAGLVVLNNTDFGLPALGATLAAIVFARPPRSRAAALALAARGAAGLALALALVSLLTLLRAGVLPQPDRMFAYARLFGVAGFGNLPTPLLGLHLVILATFVGALATAAVRAAGRNPDVLTTGVLAWCGVFGLGTGAYFAYRSHPDTLIASFSIWALALAVLTVVVVRTALDRGSLRPSLPSLAVCFGFGIAACSIAQLPLPWLQVERIVAPSQSRPLEQADAVDFVRDLTRPGDTVAILTPLGHRIAYNGDVTNVMAYTGMAQMPTAEQLQETIDAVRAGGGSTIFVGDPYPPEALIALGKAGFRSVAIDPTSGLIAWKDRR